MIARDASIYSHEVEQFFWIYTLRNIQDPTAYQLLWRYFDLRYVHENASSDRLTGLYNNYCHLRSLEHRHSAYCAIISE